MDPTVWGPSFWFVLHTVSLNYPERPTYVEKRTHHDFYRIVQHILPCEACRRHYKELFATYPIEPFLTSKQSLVTWVVMIHNQVNKRLGKPLVTTQEVLANYKQVYARGSFCDPARCKDVGRHDGTPGAASGTRLSPAAMAACAGGGTVAVLLLAFGLWYTIRRLRTATAAPA